jgi:hypothetical protein
MLLDTGLDGVDDGELGGELDGELDGELRAEVGTELGAELDLDEGDEGVDKAAVHGGVTDGNVVFGVFRGVLKIGVIFFFSWGSWGTGNSFCIGALLPGSSMLIRFRSMLFNSELLIIGGGIILSIPPVS